MVVYGLVFVIAHIPNLIKKKYFNHEAKVKILIKSISHINNIYNESTPSEKKEIENSLKNLSISLSQKKQDSECKKNEF